MASRKSEVRGATAGIAVTPSDATILDVTRGLWVGGAGNLVVRFVDAPSTSVTITGVSAGALLPFQVVQVMNASGATTATSIVALY